MGVPERQLLAAMGYTEGVVDVEHLHPTRIWSNSRRHFEQSR
jgi:hypothetical protein